MTGHAKLSRRPAARSQAVGVWHPGLGVDSIPSFSADHHIGTALRETFRAFARSVAANLRPLNLSLNMWFALRTLWEMDGLTQVQLAAKLELTPAAIVGLINALEDAGLVVRKRSTTDGRAFRVFLTAAGRKLRGKATGLALRVDAKALQNFTIAEVETLLNLIRRLRINLAE